MKKSSGRTKTYYEKQGYIVASVEFWNSFAGNVVFDKMIQCPSCHSSIKTFKKAGLRVDLFKFADLIMFHPQKDDVILVQSSAGSRHADHLKTILDNHYAESWVQSVHRRLILISWSQRAQRNEDGKLIKNKDGSPKRKTWQPRIQEVCYEDFC